MKLSNYLGARRRHRLKLGASTRAHFWQVENSPPSYVSAYAAYCNQALALTFSWVLVSSCLVLTINLAFSSLLAVRFVVSVQTGSPI